jgi:sulfur carrier protein ThiS
MEKVTLAQLQESPDKYKDVVIYTAKADENVIVANNGEWIPKSKFDDERGQLKKQQTDLENQIKTLQEANSATDKELKKLAKAAEGNEALTKQIEELQTKRKEDSDNWTKEKEALNQKYELDKKALHLKENLLNAGVGDPKARDILAKDFDLSKLEIDSDGKIKGFDDMLKPLKENKAFAGMFGETKFEGNPHNHGNPNQNDGQLFTEDELNSMSAEYVQKNNLTEKYNKSVAHFSKK